MKKVIFSLLLGLGFINTSVAAGDVEAGKTKAGACAACHGTDGIGISDSFPNLAGQHADYIVKQLKGFQNGNRSDAVMGPMAAGLSEQDMQDLGAYFASLPRNGGQAAGGADAGATAAAPAAPAFEPDPAIGKSLYELGDESRAIGQCIGCHGKDGKSDVLIYPNLYKQHPEYIAKQLKNFKSGDRQNYAMNQFAGAMTDDEIAHVAAYFADTEAVANIKVRKPVAPVAMSDSAIAGKAKAAVCAACHSADGNSVVAMNPKLAGQSATYIVKQLKAFKDGSRANAIMAPMAAALSEQDMTDLANYFASQKSTLGDGQANDLGQKLYLSGDAERGITACVACHSINGSGMPSAGFPALAKQHSGYLKTQLELFRKGERANDNNAMMRNIAIKLEDEDIEALAQYMSSLK